MKHYLLKTWLMLVCLIVGVGTTWAETYTGTVSTSSGTVSDNSFTLNSVTWNITTTSGAGSPTITYGNSYSQKCIKFGSGASNSFGSVSLSTDYFKNNNKKVTKVEVNALGSAKKNVTFSIGTSTTTQEVPANAWTKITIDNLNVTETLKLDFALNGAGFFINQVVVTYEANTGGSTPTQYSYTLETVGNGTTTFKDANGNTVVPNQKVNSGTKLIPTFTPADGYEFKSWEYYTSAGAWSNLSGTDFTITKDVQFRVTYSESQGGGEEPGGGDSQPTSVSFDNLGYSSWGKSASFSGSTYDELSQTKDNVTFTYTRGSGSTYANTTSIRFYKDNKLKFEAPSGYKITSIVWTGSGFKDDVTTDVNTCTSSTSALSWAGEASSVTFSRPSSADSYMTLSSVTVTLKSNGPSTISNLIKTSSADLYVGDAIEDLKTYLNLPNDYAGTVTFSSTSDAVEIEGDYLLTAAAGTATINVTAAAYGNYLETTGTISLNITKKTPVIAWTNGTKESYTIFNVNGNKFTEPTAYLTTSGPAINYSISGDAVIDETYGTVLWENTGTYVVTAQTAETDEYNASNAITYTIKVVDPAITMTPESGTVSAENPTVTFIGNGVKIEYMNEGTNVEETAGTTISVDADETETYTVSITDDAGNTFDKNFDVWLLQNAGLQFSANELRVLVGSEDFVEPTLTKATDATVTYSLVYEKEENVDKVATIDPATGKLTLKKLSTETQGAVTVKATTPATDEYTAGEATYSLVVYRNMPSFTWSETSITIDQDELDKLPTAIVQENRKVTSLTSSNTDVATIVDGAVTFVGYGTTTITGKTTGTWDYAIAQASYELTFAPRYTVTFNVNGDETVLREETTGAGVTAPEVEAVADYTFAGWATAAVASETTDAQTFVTLNAGKYMPTESTTLYAVYKRLEVAEGGSADEGEFLLYADVNGTKYYMASAPQKAQGSTIINEAVSNTNRGSAFVYNVAKTDDGKYTFSFEEDGATKYVIAARTGSSGSYKYYLQSSTTLTDEAKFSLSVGVKGTTRVSSCYSNMVMAYRASTYNVFRIYNSSNIKVDANEYFDLELEQISGGSTTYYTSDPVLEVATINVSQYKNTTLCLSRAYTMPEGLVGKTVSAKEGSAGEYTLTLTTKYEEGDVVPAGEALVVQGAQGTYTALAAASDGAKTAYPENLLVAEYTAQDEKFLTSYDNTNADNYYYYKLTTKNGANFGWYYGAEDGVPFLMSSKERAYLVIEKEVAQSIRAFRLDDIEGEGTLTGIEGVVVDANETIYNLQGQRMNRLQKGVNIINGRKVLR